MYEEAIALDPGFAMAYAGLAFTHMADAICAVGAKTLVNPDARLTKWRTRHSALDDSLDTPHYVLGLIYVLMREYDKAIAEGERAVELNPNGAEALAFLG